MKIYITVFTIFIAFSVGAQMEVSVFSSPFSAITGASVLIPLGVELQPSDRWSFYAEIGLPYNRTDKTKDNGSVINLKAQLRAYSQKIKINRFKFYLTFEIDRLALFYSIHNSDYKNKLDEYVRFGYADVGNVINSLNLKIGSKFVFKKRFIFDLNLGYGLSVQTINYYNIFEKPTAWSYLKNPSHLIYLQGHSYGDNYLKIGSTVITSLRGSIRIGYLL